MASSSSSPSNYYEPSDLRLGCPIFLSHSGSDKDFASFLEQALCNRGYRVFFDKEILPKAVPVSMANILGEAKNCCKLGLLVLSDDFFEKTRNPMLELATFVEHAVDLLPLFYNLSVDEFKDESRRERWYKKWRTWVPEDVISKWKAALRRVSSVCGIEFCKEAPNRKMYIDIIVDKVCEILPIDLSHISEPFQGRKRLCKFVAEMFERVESLHKTESHTVVDKENCTSHELMDMSKYTCHTIQHVISENMVAGVHGFGGSGKSSLCKALCDSYFAEFKGRTCHIEMGSDGGPFSRLTKVLSCFGNHLSMTRLDEEQLWNLLRDIIQLSSKPVFLAIDNVVAEESIDEAEKYLKCGPFPKGSKIFITARNLRVLQRVTKHEKSSVLAKMPALDFYEARNVFLQKMGYCTKGFDEESDSEVNECVRLCTLNMGKDDYHPLMLISLAAYLASRVELYSDPLMWKGVVAELSSDRCSALDRVFKVVDLIYRDLSQEEKSVYIDLALYSRHVIDDKRSLHTIKAWLCALYDKPATKVEKILCKLETSSLTHINEDGFYVHDLVKDFAKSKVEEESNSLACFFLEKYEVDCANNTLRLEGNKWYTRMAITKCAFKHGTTLDLSKFDRLEVLHLVHNQGINKVILSHKVFDRKLRSLIVRCAHSSFRDSPPSHVIICIPEESTAECKQEESINRLSLIDLEKCIIKKENKKRSWMRAFLWSPNQSIACMSFKRLVCLRMRDVQGFVLDNLGEFPLLEELYLNGVAVKTGSINCPRLKSLDLRRLTGVKTISGLEKSPCLKRISILCCNKLQSLRTPDTHLFIRQCPDLGRVNFCLPVGEAICKDLPYWSFIHCGRLKEIVRGEYKINLQQRGPLTVRKPACDIVKWEGNINSLVDSVNLHNFKLPCAAGGNISSPGFASLHKLHLWDAQHTSHLISALHVGNVGHLRHLDIRCTRKKAGGCGCDEDPPAFDLLGAGGPETLWYSCSRIRDLSCIGQCGSVEHLKLKGCGSVERWPEFAHMSSLTSLSLTNCTSLSQWPAIPAWRVQVNAIDGCINLPCKELLKPMFLVPPPATCEENLNSTRDEDLWNHSLCHTLMAILWAVRSDIQGNKKDWYSVAEALMPNSPQLLSILLLPKRRTDQYIHGLYDQKAVLSRLLYDMIASSESDCYSRFGYGYPAVSCKETRIVSFLKPLLAAREVVTTLLQEFLDVPESQRWTITKTELLYSKDDDYVPPYILRRSEYKEEQLNLVLVGLVSIKMLNMSVDEGLADLMAQIVQSFVSREDHSMQAGELHVMELEVMKHRLYYYKLLVMRVKEAVCRMAMVARVAQKLGETFMMSNIYSDLQERVAQEYASYLDGSLYANLSVHTHFFNWYSNIPKYDSEVLHERRILKISRPKARTVDSW